MLNLREACWYESDLLEVATGVSVEISYSEDCKTIFLFSLRIVEHRASTSALPYCMILARIIS